MTQERRLLLAIGSISAISLFGIWLLLIRYLPETLDHLTRACSLTFLMFMNDPMHLIGLAAGGAATTVTLIGVFTFLATLQKSKRMLAGLRSTRRSNLPPEVLSLARRQGIDEGAIELVDSPDPLAFCHGVFRRRILVSTGLLASLSAKELEAVMIHEACHFRNHHPRKILIGELLARSLFFLPIVRELILAFGLQIEVDADQAAIRTQHSTSFIRQALAKSLEGKILPAMAMFHADRLEARVARLASPATRLGMRFSRRNMLLSAALLATIGFLLLPGTKVQADRPQGEASCMVSCPQHCQEEGALFHSSLYSPAAVR